MQMHNKDTCDFNDLEMCYQDCYSEQFFLVKGEFFFSFSKYRENVYLYVDSMLNIS